MQTLEEVSKTDTTRTRELEAEYHNLCNIFHFNRNVHFPIYDKQNHGKKTIPKLVFQATNLVTKGSVLLGKSKF
jgi:hypothetical protein